MVHIRHVRRRVRPFDGDVEKPTFYCVLQTRDYRLLYLGSDLEQAKAVMTEATYCASGHSIGDAQLKAATEVGRMRRGKT